MFFGLCRPEKFTRESGPDGEYVHVGGRRLRVGTDVWVEGETVSLIPTFPGEPARIIAGAGKVSQDAIVLAGIIAGLVGLVWSLV